MTVSPVSSITSTPSASAPSSPRVRTGRAPPLPLGPLLGSSQGSLTPRSVAHTPSARPNEEALDAIGISVELDTEPEKMHPYVTVIEMRGNLYSLTLNVPVFEIPVGADETKLNKVLEKYEKPFREHLEKSLPADFDMAVSEQMKVSFLAKGYDIDIQRPQTPYRQEVRGPEAERLSQIISGGDAETIENGLNSLTVQPKAQPSPAVSGQGVHGIARGPQVWTCGFNSVIQYFNADPYLSLYLRQEKSADPAFVKLREILLKYDNNESISDDILVLRNLMGFDANRQLDAHEIADRILDLIPEDDQLLVRQTCQYKKDNLPPLTRINRHNQTINESTKFVRLEIPKDADQADLTTMIETFSTPNFTQVEFQKTRYPVTETTEIALVPHALHININRLDIESGEKIDTPVQIPDEIEIVVAGQKKQYRLASFVSHNGKDFINANGVRDSGGHFVAGRVADDDKYYFNDAKVTKDPANWDEILSQAYLVCYLPVESD